jgi:riboflavin biosynthesis pyrimidine reductase
VHHQKSVIGVGVRFKKLGPELGAERGPYTFETLGFPRGDRPYIIFNGIVSVDGVAQPTAGVDRLSSAADRMLLRRLRSQVDAVLVGGGTLRTDPICIRTAPELLSERGQQFQLPHPLGVGISYGGNVPDEHPFWQSPSPVLFLGPATPLARVAFWRSRVAVRQFDRIPEILHQLHREFAVQVVLSEGGPQLNRLLLAAGLGDELFLTIAPLISGEGGERGIIGGTGLLGRGLRLISVWREGEHLFLRYAIAAPGSGGEDT